LLLLELLGRTLDLLLLELLGTLDLLELLLELTLICLLSAATTLGLSTLRAADTGGATTTTVLRNDAPFSQSALNRHSFPRAFHASCHLDKGAVGPPYPLISQFFVP
jgi:hypothetical protein